MSASRAPTSPRPTLDESAAKPCTSTAACTSCRDGHASRSLPHHLEGWSMTRNTGETVGPLTLASKLFDIGAVDTVYRDLYVLRARTVLSAVFSADQFRAIEQQKADLAMLPLMIGRAVDRS